MAAPQNEHGPGVRKHVEAANHTTHTSNTTASLRHVNAAPMRPAPRAAQIDDILANLEGVKTAGDGYTALCPAHPDRNPSLSIGTRADGGILLFCHSGCTFPEILAACGMQTDSISREKKTPSEISAAFIERQQAIHIKQLKGQQHAQRMWKHSCDASVDHPYLIAKQVKPYGIRQMKGALLIPMRDSDGHIWNLQLITPDRVKKFQYGCRVTGLYHAIGKFSGKVPVELMVIAEGYATAASVHEATGYPVAVALTAGNLEPVAKTLRSKYPNLRIVIAADNDAATALKIGRNPGLHFANRAAAAVGGLVAFPEFSA